MWRKLNVSNIRVHRHTHTRPRTNACMYACMYTVHADYMHITCTLLAHVHVIEYVHVCISVGTSPSSGHLEVQASAECKRSNIEVHFHQSNLM